MRINDLRKFVPKSEIEIAKVQIPTNKSKDFYLGIKKGIAIAVRLVKLFDKKLASTKLAAILIILNEELKI